MPVPYDGSLAYVQRTPGARRLELVGRDLHGGSGHVDRCGLPGQPAGVVDDQLDPGVAGDVPRCWASGDEAQQGQGEGGSEVGRPGGGEVHVVVVVGSRVAHWETSGLRGGHGGRGVRLRAYCLVGLGALVAQAACSPSTPVKTSTRAGGAGPVKIERLDVVPFSPARLPSSWASPSRRSAPRAAWSTSGGRARGAAMVPTGPPRSS